MSVLTVSPEYKTLLKKAAPKVIHTEEENEAYTEILYDLDRRSKELTPAEKDLAELLTLLIENFEKTNYRLPRSKPLDVLRFLIDQHELRQKDLVSVFGTPSIVSDWRLRLTWIKPLALPQSNLSRERRNDSSSGPS